MSAFELAVVGDFERIGDRDDFPFAARGRRRERDEPQGFGDRRTSDALPEPRLRRRGERVALFANPAVLRILTGTTASDTEDRNRRCRDEPRPLDRAALHPESDDAAGLIDRFAQDALRCLAE